MSARQKIEFDATNHIVDVRRCFHNLALHGSGEHLQPDCVRWALDLRYERAPDPTRYKKGDQYYRQFPSFLCHVGHADSSSGEALARRHDELVSWQEWLEMWSVEAKAEAKPLAEQKAEENVPKSKPRL